MRKQKNRKKKENKGLDNTDGLKKTLKNIFESNLGFLAEEVENSALSDIKKLFFKKFTKFLAIITSEKYITIVKIQEIIKFAITTAI